MEKSNGSRRNFIKKSVLAAAGLGLAGHLHAEGLVSSERIGLKMYPEDGEFTLPKLQYAENALEPHIDAMTMGIHHGKHHAGYVSKLNAALDKAPQLKGKSLEELLKNINSIPEDVRTAVRNNGGGHWNHSMYWQVMSPDASKREVSDSLRKAMMSKWNDMDTFAAAFKTAAGTLFGSGWAWVIKDKQGDLSITTTPNQDNPLMDVAENRGMPILGIDVWEHAYYLKNQNRRGDYISSFLQVVDWSFVSKQYGGM